MSGAAQLNAKTACKMNSLEHELLTFCTVLCFTDKCQAFVLVRHVFVLVVSAALLNGLVILFRFRLCGFILSAKKSHKKLTFSGSRGTRNIL